MISDMTNTVVIAEERRCAAMLGNDISVLDALLDERLVFGHATGVADDKPSYLAKLASGQITYLDIHWSDRDVIGLSPDIALMSGGMISDVRVNGEEKRLRNRVLMVWTYWSGEWRLTAFQGTAAK